MKRPKKCPNCGQKYKALKPPTPNQNYSKMCFIGTLKDQFSGWKFYHD